MAHIIKTGALKRQATDLLWPVRRNVAASPKADISLLKDLAADADERPRLEAEKRLAALEVKPIPQVVIAREHIRMAMPAKRLVSLVGMDELENRAQTRTRRRKAIKTKKARKLRKAARRRKAAPRQG